MVRRLHHDTRAQVSFLGLVGAFVLIGMLAMIMNTGDVLRHRMHMQSTADVTAISAATWTARGMNTVAMINVLNTKLLSMTVITNSAQKTVEVLIPIATGQSAAFAACSGVPIVGGFCIAMKVVVDIQKGVLESALKPVLTNLKNSVTACPKAAWKVMEAMSKAAEVIAVSFPKIGYAEGISIASINGASSGWVVEGSALRLGSENLADFARLPVSTDDAALNDFCGPMLSGGKGFELQGYPEGFGPAKYGKEKIWDKAWYAFVNLFAHPIFNGFYRSELTWMQCGVEDEEDSGQDVTFYHLDDCRQHQAKAEWTRFTDKTGWLPHSDWTSDDFIAWVPRNSGGGGLTPDQRNNFGGLEGLSGNPVSIPGTAINHQPRRQGVDELTNQTKGGTTKRTCTSSSSSGYPRVGIHNLKNHPDYVHYEVDEGGVHSRASTSRREATGAYFLKVNTETQYRGDVPIDDNGDGEPDRTEEKIYSALRWNIPEAMGGAPDSERPYLDPEYQYALDVFSLTSAGSKKLEGEELDEYLEDEYGVDTSQGNSHGGGQCGTYPKPHLMVEADSTPDKLRYFSVVTKSLTPDQMPFWSRYFDQSPNRFIAFSQAQVYNELSADTFTQDWRVRLERATLLNSALERAEELGLGPIAGAAGDILDTVNNH